jgi:hypothetical protein
MKGFILFIKSHWKGEIPYAKSYLFVILLVAIAVRRLSILSFAYIPWDDSVVNKLILSYVLSFSVLITVWCGVGTIRYLINKVSSTFALLGFIIFIAFFIQTVRTYYLILSNAVV